MLTDNVRLWRVVQLQIVPSNAADVPLSKAAAQETQKGTGEVVPFCAGEHLARIWGVA